MTTLEGGTTHSDVNAKPCPFCGKDGGKLSPALLMSWFVQCEYCGAQGPTRVRPSEALEEWNSVDLPSVRREAAAQAWDAAADYAEGFDEPMAREFRARAASLREGTPR